MSFRDYYVDSSGIFKALKNSLNNKASLRIYCDMPDEKIPLICLSMVSNMKKEGVKVKTIPLSQSNDQSIWRDSHIYEWFYLHQRDINKSLSTSDKSFIKTLIFTGHRVIIGYKKEELPLLIDRLNDKH